MTTLANLFLIGLVPGLVVWSVLYISDYYSTLAYAKLYRSGANEKIVFEGSIEITPQFQPDIDSLRKVSPRFLAALFRGGVGLAAIWWLSRWSQQPGLYEFALGAMISLQLAVHMRHLRNLYLFRAIARNEGVQGRIEYSRQLMLRMSSVELLGFGGLFSLLFVFTRSWFVLGGAYACLLTAWKHRRLAQRHASSALPNLSPSIESAPDQLRS